jgi:hypothetical protein
MRIDVKLLGASSCGQTIRRLTEGTLAGNPLNPIRAPIGI